MTRMTRARRRGLYPEPAPIDYGDLTQTSVTISLARDSYDALARMTCNAGPFWCVEVALCNAADAMIGKCAMIGIAEEASLHRGVPMFDVLFGDIPNNDEGAAARRLFEALGRMVNAARASDAADDAPEPEIDALMRTALNGEAER